MTITIRLFAALRERAGWSQRELDGVERVADVWPALGLGEEPPGLLVAVGERAITARVLLVDRVEEPVRLLPEAERGPHVRDALDAVELALRPACALTQAGEQADANCHADSVR